MNPYMTIQQKDYTAKKPKFFERVAPPPQEFRDPVSEGFKHYLDYSNKSPPAPKQFADDYVEILKSQRQKVGKLYFATPIHREILAEDEQNLKKTTYEAEYVYSDQTYEDPFARIDASLSREWVVPETTSASAYRDPVLFDKSAHQPTKPIRGINNLGPNEKINDILQTKTGITEYEAIIGYLGGSLIEQQIHGKVIHS